MCGRRRFVRSTRLARSDGIGCRPRYSACCFTWPNTRSGIRRKSSPPRKSWDRRMRRMSDVVTRESRSPTPALLVGLVVTLAAVVGVSWYITRQLSGLRALQTDLADRNRTDSLQLLRIQNDLNSLALAMRDMLDTEETYPLTAWTAQFARIRTDLESALAREAQVATARRTPEQNEYLTTSLAQFWAAADRIFALAASGDEAD